MPRVIYLFKNRRKRETLKQERSWPLAKSLVSVREEDGVGTSDREDVVES